jgi:hypothetical protein
MDAFSKLYGGPTKAMGKVDKAVSNFKAMLLQWRTSNSFLAAHLRLDPLHSSSALSSAERSLNTYA